jgi:hypothetical protein
MAVKDVVIKLRQQERVMKEKGRRFMCDDLTSQFMTSRNRTSTPTKHA